jgi:hypothetical protein
MAQLIADRRDIDFVLFEQLDTEALTKEEKYKEFNRKTFDLIINEARAFALKELLPVNAEGDRQGVTLEEGVVKVPACYHRAYKLYLEGEWTSLEEPVGLGGQGLPPNVAPRGPGIHGRRELLLRQLCQLRPWHRQNDPAFRNGRAEKAVCQKPVHRPLDRRHAAHRVRGRIGCGGFDHRGG